MPITYPYTQYGGIWKLNAASAAQGAGTWPVPPSPILQYFSTTLYTGNGSTQTINNGIDLAGEGGMVWCKLRSTTGNNNIHDTVRGYQYSVFSESTSAQTTSDAGKDLTSFNSNGFSIGPNNYCGINTNGESLVSWTFRKAPKFFDVVTYTGDGTSTQTISHSLATQPGMIMIKKISDAGIWQTFARNGSSYYSRLQLQSTSASSSNTITLSDVASSSSLNVGWISNNWSSANDAGANYVAYLFAHDAAADGLIQCGSLPDTAGTVVNLGWQPQYILWKKSGSTSYWYIFDSARGMTSTVDKTLSPNSTNAELTYTPPSIPFVVSSTGFTWQYSGWDGTAGADAIYMAIRDPNS